MEFEITHVTHYKYGHAAAEAYGEARLTPPNLPSQTVLSHRIVIDPEVKTSGYVDHFGNRVDGSADENRRKANRWFVDQKDFWR